MTVLLSPLSTAVAREMRVYRIRKGQIMSSTTGTRTAISPTPPAMLRLRLQPDGSATMPAGLLTAIYAAGLEHP
jgi:hypothetical protein